MNNPRKIPPFYRRLGLGLLLGALALQAQEGIRKNSPAIDEPHHITMGYVFLKKGKFNLNMSNPPLINQILAAPLFLLNLEFPGKFWSKIKDLPISTIPTTQLAVDLIFYNTQPAEKILLVCRLAALSLSCLLALLIYAWTRQCWGDAAALASVFLYTTCPSIVAHSGLAMIDLGAGLFLFLAIASLWRMLHYPSRWSVLGTGLAFGFILAAKVSGIFVFPFAAAILLAHRYKNPSWDVPLKSLLAVVLIASAFLVLDYFIVELPRYLTSLRWIFGNAIKRGWSNYLFGHKSPDGWIYYFVVNFLFKMPPASIALMALGSYWAYRTKNGYFLLIPVVMYFALASTSKVQLGIRHLLPIFPFLFMMGGLALGRLLQNPKTRWIGSLAILTLLIERVSTYPNDLAYLSPLAGGPSAGWRLIQDSDYGQNFKRLGDYLSKRPGTEVVLSSNQTAPAEYYGIHAQNYFSNQRYGRRPFRLNSLAPLREILAVDTSVLLNMPEKFNSLKNKKIADKIGQTVFIYDITQDEEFHRQMLEEYEKEGLSEQAEHERQRIQAIAKNSQADSGFSLNQR